MDGIQCVYSTTQQKLLLCVSATLRENRISLRGLTIVTRPFKLGSVLLAIVILTSVDAPFLYKKIQNLSKMLKSNNYNTCKDTINGVFPTYKQMVLFLFITTYSSNVTMSYYMWW